MNDMARLHEYAVRPAAAMIWITSGPGMVPAAAQVGRNTRFTAIRQGWIALLFSLCAAGACRPECCGASSVASPVTTGMKAPVACCMPCPRCQ
ncbi:hypothetical protein LU298_11140 [Komagataeibacter intermedius]|uniref:hypothetical protein n=1 Tax=Komagataeibacter intermedius TaxID=66229 RepID=UPI0006628E31|nr:hypothetical protein [Komagataeibacter intermedius]MCF3637049.1 hypothetical protein [Komagataeibacter intermedius]